jgi:3-deoxy-7-phosphoheptulonate synthase
MSLAAVAAGADGIIIEVHNNPETALCDGDQALTPAMFTNIMRRLRPLKSFVDQLPSC